MFFGKNWTVTFENCPDRVCGWQGALSINRRICLSLRFNWRFSFDRIVVTISLFIQALLLAKQEQLYGRLGECKFIKHLGLTDVPITTGSSVSPSAFTKNAHASRCFAFFPPVHRLPLASKVFSGRPRQKQHVSSMFQTSRAFHPAVISLARSFQLSIVLLLTSTASPATVLLQMLYFCLNFSSQPLEATKSEISNFYAINVASSWSIEPETGMLEFLHIVYQSYTAWFTSEYLDERFLFAWFGVSLLA